MSLKRVAITGAGTINALGRDVPTTLASMREARLGIGALDLPEIERLSIRIGGQVKDFPEPDRYTRQELSLFDR